MRVLSICISSVLAFDDDHISVLQQKVSADMHDRASRVSSFSSQLDAAVAGKKSKCNAIEAAELVSCLRIGEVNALDLLTQGDSIDDAVEEISNRAGGADCHTLRRDMRCMQQNPCYSKVLKAMPLTFDIAGEQDIKVKSLCSTYKSELILDDSNITWGMVCGESPRDLCSVMYDNVQEIKSDYDACEVTCTSIGGTEAETASTAKFVLASKYNEMCSEESIIKREIDCKTAAEKIEDGKKLPFRAIRYQKRPAGCFKFKGKVYWNHVRKGAAKKGRMPLCMSVQ